MSIRVAVLDMQPIDPPVGGGRLRLFGLYHDLGPEFETHYVGTYDWPGEKRRRQALSESLTEEDVPLSPEHFREDAKWRELAGGTNVIDTAFAVLGRLSPDFVAAVRRAVAGADIVIFSHPWIHPLVADALDPTRQLVVYDAHNVESLLRWDLLGDRPFNREVAKGVIATEFTLARASHLLMACSGEDARFFAETFSVPQAQICIAPNGVFVNAIRPPDVAAREQARRALGLDGSVAVFLGSQYGPNVEAARFVAETLCARFPAVTFACCGGVGADAALRTLAAPNLRLPGQLSEEEKLRWLHAADLAINPMFSGSGTNIKMFDFMAAGLPIVATSTGARGIARQSTAGIVIAERSTFADALGTALASPRQLAEFGEVNRSWVERKFAWESISPALGRDLSRAFAALREPEHRGRPPETGGATVPAAPSSAFQGLPRARQPRIALLTTFGIKCGIAEYAAYLARAMTEAGAEVSILGNDRAGFDVPAEASLLDVAGTSVQTAWFYDHLRWKDSRIDLERVARALEEGDCTHLNIQYHPGFYKEPQLLALVEFARGIGRTVSVTLHNSAQSSPELLRAFARHDVTTLVHKRKEAARLADLAGAAVRYLPHGVLDHAVSPEPAVSFASGSRPAVIATFGFLRTHKGFLELIRSLPILRRVFPGTRLMAQTALYPSTDSVEYLADVRKQIAAEGLTECVELDHEYRPIGAVIDRLASADLIVLPYAASDEGGSGSLAIAMAARRPLVLTRAEIFAELMQHAYVADSNAPTPLAVAICTVLASAPLRALLEQSAVAAATEASWATVARQMLALDETTG